MPHRITAMSACLALVPSLIAQNSQTERGRKAIHDRVGWRYEQIEELEEAYVKKDRSHPKVRAEAKADVLKIICAARGK